MRCQYIRKIIRQLISKEDMFLWLSRGNLKGQTTSDQALQTKYHATKILPTEADNKCRLCQQFHETVPRIMSVWPVMAIEQYMKGQDSVSAELDFNMRKATAVQSDNKHRDENLSRSVPQFMKLRLPYYGTDRYEPTELFLTITNRTVPNNNRQNCS